MLPALGEFVPTGAPIFEVDPETPTLDTDEVTNSVVLALEQDVSYGVRLLVDIAERSLADSPFQDPTTAVQAIDRLRDCLRQLARRPFPSGDCRDEDGTSASEFRLCRGKTTCNSHSTRSASRQDRRRLPAA